MTGSRQSDRTRDAAAFFAGSRLTLARHLAGLRKNALAERIGKTPTAVTAFEHGTKRPSPRTVALLALALGVEPSFFIVTAADPRAAAGPPHFRSLRSTTQPARDQAHAYGLLAIDIATALERHVEFPPPDVPTASVDPENLDETDPEESYAEDAARSLRAQWGLPAGPVGHLVRIAEHHGVLVVFSPIQTAAVDAYSLDTPARPVVLLNPLKQDYFRQRFDLAHELGHLVMHGDAEPGGRMVEEQANRFAAELLMPAAQLRHLLPRRADWLVLGRLKEQWKVSLQALLFRARRLGVMSDVTYRNAMTTVSAKGWRRREPGPMPAVEQPSLLPKAVELLTQAGVTEMSLAAQCNVPQHLFAQITARAPAPPNTAPEAEPAPQPGTQILSLLAGNPCSG